MYPKNTEIDVETKPTVPVTKIKNIAIGIKSKIKIFVGIETRDKIPVR